MESLLYLTSAAVLGALAAGRSSLGKGLLAAGTGLLVLYALLVGFPGLLPAASY